MNFVLSVLTVIFVYDLVKYFVERMFFKPAEMRVTIKKITKEQKSDGF